MQAVFARPAVGGDLEEMTLLQVSFFIFVLHLHVEDGWPGRDHLVAAEEAATRGGWRTWRVR